MKTEKVQPGQAIILIVFAIIGMLGLAALAIDGGNAFADRRHAQNAADAAALAGALAKASGQNYTDAALGSALMNGYGYQVTTVNVPPQAGCNGQASLYAGNSEYIQVIIHSDVDTYFASVVGVRQIHNCVEAIARGQPAHTEPMVYGNAMVSLNPHDCQAVRVHGTSDTVLIDGGLFVNSDSSCIQGAFNQSGNSSLNAPGVCVVGSSSYNAGDVIPPPTHCAAVPYPPNFIMPAVSCTDNGTRSNGVLTPGNIPGSWLSSDVVLQSGVYCISGDATINAHDSITGSNVLLYFVDGGIHINGGAQISIDAMDTGPYAGLLIYLPLDNDSSIILNGNSDSVFTGSVLAPASDIQINGTESADTYQTQVIGYSLDIIGTSDAVIRYNDNQNYDATIPPAVEIVR